MLRLHETPFYCMFFFLTDGICFYVIIIFILGSGSYLRFLNVLIVNQFVTLSLKGAMLLKSLLLS